MPTKTKPERTEELAVIEAARFGSDLDYDGDCVLRLTLQLLGGGVTIFLNQDDYPYALKAWKCSDVSKLKGRACAVLTTGLAGDRVKWGRAL